MSRVRPWNEFWNEIAPGRFVYARAIFTAFSTASAPLLKNALFPSGRGATARRAFARATSGS